MQTGGNGNVSVKYVEPNTVRVTAGSQTVVDFTPTQATFSQDVSIPGGQIVLVSGYHKNLIQAQSTAMTASSFLSHSSGLNAASMKSQLRRPMLRAGSILGLSLYCEDANFTAIGTQVFASGAMTGTVTLDGVNTALTLVCTPSGSNFLSTLQSKDAIPFSASQTIGVTLTASAGYGSDQLTYSASWMATVLVEL